MTKRFRIFTNKIPHHSFSMRNHSEGIINNQLFFKKLSAFLLQPEQGLQASVNAREAHESKTQ